MSLPKNQQEELFTVINELPDFLREDDPMMVFSKTIYPAFTDKDFEDCYSTKGRNAISPAFLACVTLLQFRENLSDPETAEAVVRRLDWKIALHLRLRENVSFDSSTLCYYRRRLKENGKICLIFDKIIGLAQEKGFIKKRTKQRIDATHIISHVNRISTTDLLFRTVKCLVEEIEQKDPEYYGKELPEHIKERYSEQFSSFGMSKDKRADKLAEIVEDGLYLKSLLEKVSSPKLDDLIQLEIMNTIFEENVKITTKEIEDKIFVEVEEIQTPHQTIFDPRDTSVKLSKKGKTTWVGSKCHVVETAEKGKINFITNMIYQRANEDDSRIHDRVKEGNEQRGLRPEKLYVDSNYINGSAIGDYRNNGQELMGYIQGDSSKKPEAFKLQRFAIDMNTLKAVCPAGKESSSTSSDRRNIKISFSRAACKDCAFYQDCVGERKAGVRGLTLTPGYEYVRERREDQQTEAFREEMKVRAQVEGTISEGVRFFGLRHAKYKGKDGHKFQFYMTGAALNVKRVIKAITKGIEIPRKTSTAYTI